MVVGQGRNLPAEGYGNAFVRITVGDQQQCTATALLTKPLPKSGDQVDGVSMMVVVVGGG